MRLGLLVVVLGCRLHFDPVSSSSDPDARDSGSAADSSVVTADGNIAFVASVPVQLTVVGTLQGLDTHCESLAAAAALPSSAYVAWFSTSSITAPARLGSARGWVRPDRAPFADTVSDLLAGNIYYPLELVETGAPHVPVGIVATGTTAAGTPGQSCDDLTNSLGMLQPAACSRPRRRGPSSRRRRNVTCRYRSTASAPAVRIRLSSARMSPAKHSLARTR